MKVLYWLGLIVALIGILINQNIIDVNIIKISSFWIEAIAVGLLAISGFPKGK
ncbi:MAG: hypothetical protein K6U80_10475 [Firmicutes bacterium]|nr:hypothetical protein [Bacillota bacterium]